MALEKATVLNGSSTRPDLREKRTTLADAAHGSGDPGRSRARRPGIAESIRMRRDAQVARQEQYGDGWLTRKFTVGLVFAFFGYSTYAFVARVCIPLVQQSPDHPGSRAAGIVYLVFYWPLWIMFVWSYFMIITTSPGEVKKLIPQDTSPPEEPASQRLDHPLPSADLRRSTSHHSATRPLSHAESARQLEDEADVTAEEGAAIGTFGPMIGSLFMPSSEPEASIEASSPSRAPLDPAEHTQTIRGHPETAYSRASDVERAEAPLERRPPTTPVLEPYFRWCRRCERVKPFRAKHCRHCGSCILKMDHHCPWVGHCVGARNYRYFLIFLIWGFVYCLYVFLVAVFDLFPPGSSRDLDGQELALIVIAGLFAFFTAGMLATHIPLVLVNMTTLEAMAATSVKQREDYQISKSFSTWDCGGRARLRKRWNYEWGEMRTTANRWWLGSSRANLEAALGKNRLSWILPIPISDASDGLSYPVNPRFTAEGVQRRREEWPEELR